MAGEGSRRYWSAACPKCDGQGRLFFEVRTADERLIRRCEECYWSCESLMGDVVVGDGAEGFEIETRNAVEFELGRGGVEMSKVVVDTQ